MINFAPLILQYKIYIKFIYFVLKMTTKKKLKEGL